MSASIQINPVAGCSACTQGLSLKIGLTPGSPGCAASDICTTCSIAVALEPGHYQGGLVTYDGPLTAGSPTGAVLSENQSFPVNVITGHANVASVTLYGVPQFLSFTSLGSPLFVFGPYDPTVDLLWPGSSGSMTVTALDADRNIILGPGAPTVSSVATDVGFTAKLIGSTITITAPAHRLANHPRDRRSRQPFGSG